VRRLPALIVGGGPAGTAAAIRLAQAGCPHLLVERSRETGDAICGGFLSWRTLDTLATLGIKAASLNPQPIDRVRLFAGARLVEAPLPRPGLTVSRHRLDSLLMARAIAAGAAVERGVTVRSIEGLAARTADGADLSADALLLASGKHDVRGLARPAAARGRDPTIGLRVRLAATPTLVGLLRGAIELHLFAAGYAGLALQEDGTANLCMAVHRSRLQAAGSPAALLDTLAATLPGLAARMACTTPVGGIDAIANVPYGWRVRDEVPGLFRLGDQAGVIPSLAGEGMGIAIASGIDAADHYRRHGAAPGWQRQFARRLRRPIGLADLVRHLAESRAAAPMLAIVPRGLIQVIASATRITH